MRHSTLKSRPVLLVVCLLALAVLLGLFLSDAPKSRLFLLVDVDTSNPDDVLMRFGNALASGEHDVAVELTIPELRSQMEFFLDDYADVKGVGAAILTASRAIGYEQSASGAAELKYDVQGNDFTKEVTLVKIEDRWYVARI